MGVASWLVGGSSDDSRKFSGICEQQKGFFGDSFQGIFGKEPKNISVSPFFPLPKIHDQKLLEFRHFGKSKLIRWTLQGSLGKRKTVQRLDIGPTKAVKKSRREIFCRFTKRKSRLNEGISVWHLPHDASSFRGICRGTVTFWCLWNHSWPGPSQACC